MRFRAYYRTEQQAIAEQERLKSLDFKAGVIVVTQFREAPQGVQRVFEYQYTLSDKKDYMKDVKEGAELFFVVCYESK